MSYLKISESGPKLLILLGSVILAGCHVHFVRDYNSIYPNVAPDPNKFVLNFTVENASSKTYEVGELITNVDVVYHTDYSENSCIYNYRIPLKRLEPDQKAVFESYNIDNNAAPGDPCRCLKGSCAGRVVLSMKTAGGTSLTGSGKKYQVNWKKSGKLEDVTVVHQGWD